MLTPRFRSIATAGLGALLVVGGCTSNDYPLSSTHVEVNGTITASVDGYGPWTGNRTATATSANGSLTITGEDGNFIEVTLFLVGVDLNSAHPDSVRMISLTPVTADTSGYFRYAEGSGTQYSTIPAGHGLVTLTHVAPDRVVGTFSFTAYPPDGVGVSPLQHTVTGGAFDIKPSLPH